MRRKSARTATKATPEKAKEKEEKTPKRRRQSRRYKQSSSESESEEEISTTQKTESSQDTVYDKQEEHDEEEPTNVVTKSSNSKRTRNRSGNNVAEEDTASPEEKTIRRSRRRAGSPKKEDLEEDLEEKRGKGKSKGKNKSKLDQTSQISDQNEMQSEISENVQVTAQSPQIDNVDINDADKVDDDGANQSIDVQTVPGDANDASVGVRQENDVRPRDDDLASSEPAKSDNDESLQCVRQQEQTPEDTPAKCSEGDESQKVEETATTTSDELSEKVHDDEPNEDNKEIEHKESKSDNTTNSLEVEAEKTQTEVVEETIEIEPKTTGEHAEVAVDTEKASEKTEEASLESEPTTNEVVNKSEEVIVQSTADEKVDEDESSKKENDLTEVVEESTPEIGLVADESESLKSENVTIQEATETSSTEVADVPPEQAEKPSSEEIEAVNVEEGNRTSEEVIEKSISEDNRTSEEVIEKSISEDNRTSEEVIEKSISEDNRTSEKVIEKSISEDNRTSEEVIEKSTSEACVWESVKEDNKEVPQWEPMEVDISVNFELTSESAVELDEKEQLIHENKENKQCDVDEASQDKLLVKTEDPNLTAKSETTEREEQKIETESSLNVVLEKTDNEEKKQEETQISSQPPRRKRSWGLTSLGLNSYDGLIEITMDVFKDMYPEITMLEETDVKLDASSSKDKHLPESAERRVSVTERQEALENKNESKESVDNIIAMNRKISIVDDDASKLRPPPSPAKNARSDILFITNLVRPFTLKQLRELLERTGSIRADGFWTDRIKSKCYVHYETVEEAEATRNALHGVHWPICNGKKLNIDYATPQCLEKARNPPPVEVAVPEKENQEPEAPLPKRVHKDSEESVGKDGKHKNDVHVWKIESAKEVQLVKRSRSKERLDKRRYSKSRLSRSPSKDVSKKKQKKEEAVPQRAMDDLFRKTETTPCIYWQPLSPEEIALKQQQRLERMAEHKRRMENHSRSKRGTDHSRGGPYRRKY